MSLFKSKNKYQGKHKNKYKEDNRNHKDKHKSAPKHSHTRTIHFKAPTPGAFRQVTNSGDEYSGSQYSDSDADNYSDNSDSEPILITTSNHNIKNHAASDGDGDGAMHALSENDCVPRKTPPMYV